MFNPGDNVVKSCKDGFNFHGWVLAAIPPDQIEEHLVNYQVIGDFIAAFDRRDPDWRQFPIYIVQPHSSPGPAPYEEAQYIIPGLTKEQYDLLMHSRRWIVLDSDLLPELGIPETSSQ